MSSRLIVVTGAARRIGAAIAKRAAAFEKCNVLFTANSSIYEANLLVGELQEYGVKAAFVQGDIIKELNDVCEKVRNHDLVIECGGVDGLVHNASIFRAAAFDGNVKETRKEIDDHTEYLKKK